MIFGTIKTNMSAAAYHLRATRTFIQPSKLLPLFHSVLKNNVDVINGIIKVN